MSSPTYSSCLKPDPWCRIIVCIAGELLIAIGLVLILTIPLDAWLRGIGVSIWTLSGRHELMQLERGWRQSSTMRICAGGELLVCDVDGVWYPAKLLDGSRVLRRLAWLRFQTASGVKAVELLRDNTQATRDWRRLQVIWRHIGTTS